MAFSSLMVQLKDVLVDEIGDERLVVTDKGFLDSKSGMTIDFILDSIPEIDEFLVFDSIRVSGLKDIAANKASALCCRDEVKDYIDMAFLTLDQKLKLADLAGLAEEKFKIGTVTEEKLIEELVSKREMFRIVPDMFLFDGKAQVSRVNRQIDFLLQTVKL